MNDLLPRMIERTFPLLRLEQSRCHECESVPAEVKTAVFDDCRRSGAPSYCAAERLIARGLREIDALLKREPGDW
jgi:hypothetical protein